MSKYTEARELLSDAMLEVERDTPEWIKTKAAIAALDRAQLLEAEQDFINASRRLDDAVSKLRAITAGLQPNPASQFLSRIGAALDTLVPLVKKADALLSGEPASALPGMPEANKATFPTPNERVVPPMAGALASMTATPTTTAAAGVAAAPSDGAARVAQMIDDILRREGGFVNHPADRGGPTNFGVTLATLGDWRGTKVTLADVQKLKKEEARTIFGTLYYSRPHINALPELLQPIVFDMSINHGPATAIKLLQEVLNNSGAPCDVDGGIGDETVASAKKAAKALGDALVNRIVARRIELFQAIVDGDASQKVFLAGWLNRAREFQVA